MVRDGESARGDEIMTNPFRRIVDWLDGRRSLQALAAEQAVTIDDQANHIKRLSREREEAKRNADKAAAEAATLRIENRRLEVHAEGLASDVACLKRKYVEADNGRITAGAGMVRLEYELAAVKQSLDDHRTVAEQATAALTVIQCVLNKYGLVEPEGEGEASHEVREG